MHEAVALYRQEIRLGSAGFACRKERQATKEFGELPVRLLSDSNHVNARRFHSYDDFEDTEVHSTMLIDRKGRLYWANFGGEPFKDMAFLTSQVERMNDFDKSETARTH